MKNSQNYTVVLLLYIHTRNAPTCHMIIKRKSMKTKLWEAPYSPTILTTLASLWCHSFIKVYYVQTQCVPRFVWCLSIYRTFTLNKKRGLRGGHAQWRLPKARRTHTRVLPTISVSVAARLWARGRDGLIVAEQPQPVALNRITL